MKKLITIGLILLSVSLFGQEYYYWCEGEKIPLELKEKKNLYCMKTDMRIVLYLS